MRAFVFQFPRAVKALEWFGTATSVAGSFTVAMGFMFWGYVLFLFGAVSWLISAWVNRNGALFALNFAFFIANIIGFVRNY